MPMIVVVENSGVDGRVVIIKLRRELNSPKSD